MFISKQTFKLYNNNRTNKQINKWDECTLQIQETERRCKSTTGYTSYSAGSARQLTKLRRASMAKYTSATSTTNARPDDAFNIFVIFNTTLFSLLLL